MTINGIQIIFPIEFRAECKKLNKMFFANRRGKVCRRVKQFFRPSSTHFECYVIIIIFFSNFIKLLSMNIQCVFFKLDGRYRDYILILYMYKL